MISNKHKNWVQNTRTKGIANNNQTHHHRLLQMDITPKLKNNPEDGNSKNKHVNINLNELSHTPNALEINDGIG